MLNVVESKLRRFCASSSARFASSPRRRGLGQPHGRFRVPFGRGEAGVGGEQGDDGQHHRLNDGQGPVVAPRLTIRLGSLAVRARARPHASGAERSPRPHRSRRAPQAFTIPCPSRDRVHVVVPHVTQGSWGGPVREAPTPPRHPPSARTCSIVSAPWSGRPCASREQA